MGNSSPLVMVTYLDNYNPATGKVITKIPNSDNEDVELAVKAAQKALPHGQICLE